MKPTWEMTGEGLKAANFMVARPYNRAIYKDLAGSDVAMDMRLMRDAMRYVQAELSVMMEDEKMLKQVSQTKFSVQVMMVVMKSFLCLSLLQRIWLFVGARTRAGAVHHDRAGEV